MEFPYLEAVIGFMILDTCQHCGLKFPTLPKTLEGVISQGKFESSRAYNLVKSHFHFGHEFGSDNTDGFSNFVFSILAFVLEANVMAIL